MSMELSYEQWVMISYIGLFVFSSIFGGLIGAALAVRKYEDIIKKRLTSCDYSDNM